MVPYSTLCLEPVLLFGSPFSAIEAIEFRKPAEKIVTNGLVYEGENEKIKSVTYVLDLRSPVLSLAILEFKNTATVTAEAYNFFAERYTLIVADRGRFIYGNEDLLILVSQDPAKELGTYAMYLKNDEKSMSPESALKKFN